MSVDNDRSSRHSRSRVTDASSDPDVISLDSPVSSSPKPVRSTRPTPGRSAAEFYEENETFPSDDDPTTPTTALDRRRSSSHGRTYTQTHSQSLTHSGTQSHGRSSRKSRKHSNTKDMIRMLINAEDRDQKEALSILRRTSERLEMETQRANEAERRVVEANERWRLINQARLQAQADAARLNEELRLYKLQLEAAQSQIVRANDIIQMADKEKVLAEEEAAKAKRLAKRYEMETLIQKAREEGRRLGRQQGLREGIDQGYAEAWTTANARLDDELRRQGYEVERMVNDDEDTIQDFEDEIQPEPMRVAGPSIPGPEMARRPQHLAPLNISRTQSDPITLSKPRRQIGLFRRRHDPQQDRNVEVNEGAPDVATIVNGEPHMTVATPILMDDVKQMNGNPEMTHMPVPDFNPDPSSVHPISVMNAPRSPLHPPVDYPPDNYIPRRDSDGAIRLPAPHDFAPMTPHQEHSPLPAQTSLPEFTPRETRAREITNSRTEPSRRKGHHDTESVGSIATSSLSIISPPTQNRGASKAPQLYAIPEASPGGSIRREGSSHTPGTPGPRFRVTTPASRSHGLPDDISERQSIINSGPIRPPESAPSVSSQTRRSAPLFGPPRPSNVTVPPLLGTQPHYTRPRINSEASSITGYKDVRSPPEGRERAPMPNVSRSRAGASNHMSDVPEITIERPSSESTLSRRSSITEGALSPRMSARSYPVIPTPELPTPKTLSGIPNNSVVSIPNTIPTIPEDSIPPGFVQIAQVNLDGAPPGFVPTTPILENAPSGFVPISPLVDGAPPGFVPTSPAPPNAPPGFIPTSPMHENVPRGFVPSPALHDAPAGFVPKSPVPADAPPGFLLSSPRVPNGFVPGSPAPPGAPSGFTITTPVPPGAPSGFVQTSGSVPGDAPPGFVPSTVIPEGAPAGFIPSPSTFARNVLPKVPVTTASPSFSMTGALPVLARSESDDYNRRDMPERISFSGPNAGFNSRAASDWDTRSAWEGTHEEHSPRPVRAPEIDDEGYVSPRSSLGPVIPDLSIFSNSNHVSSRRSSRVNFDLDPVQMPLPPSKAPSLSRTGRATSQGSGLESGSRTPGPVMSRSASARSDTSRYPFNPSNGSGLPPSGLTSPYSRRLETHAENDDESVDSSISDNTLTTPPERTSILAPPSPVSSLHGRPLSRSDRDALFLPPDPLDAARVASSLRSKVPSGEPDDRDGALPMRNPASRHSLASQKSYAKFNKEEYVDPAILTSGRSKLLPLAPDETVAGGSRAPLTAKEKRQQKKKKR